jgi:hypothetical protein
MSKSTHSTAVLSTYPGRNALSVSDHKRLISTCYQKNAANTLELAALCREAQAQIMDEDHGTLKKGLVISWSNFLKYAAIGRDDRLYAPGMEEKLPGAFSLTYQVAMIRPGAEWEAALAADMIRPDVTRKALIDWKRAFRGETAPEKKAKKTLADKVNAASPEEKAAIAALFETPVVTSPSIAAADQEAPAPAR